MGGNVLAWNVENWITVLLMVGLGYLLLSLAVQGLKGTVFNKSQG